jgi:hypothetical protein
MIKVIKKHFPEWKIPEDLCLDAETIHHLASIINLQSEWVKDRSTTLYTDPFLLEEKLRRIGTEEIIETFLRSWRPIVELEQITFHSLTEAKKYWDNLLPLTERWPELVSTGDEKSVATRKELIEQRILREKTFSEELENFWQELKNKTEEAGKNNKLDYWEFIGAETYEKTAHRAFMASFLITYGYATLEIHPLEEELLIKPYEEPLRNVGEKQLMSIPITVTTENWMKWKKGKSK